MKKLLFLFLFLPTLVNAQSWEPSGARTPHRSVTNGASFLGKGAGTIESPLQWDVSIIQPDTSAWQFVSTGSDGKYRIMKNRSTFLGKSAGTVYIELVYGVNSVAIDTANIAHLDQNEVITGNYTINYKYLKTTPVSVTNDTVFASTGSVFTKTLSASVTFKISGLSDGQIITFAVTNTASNYTVAWSALGGQTIVWSGGTTPTQTTGAKTDIYSFQRIGSNIYGAVIQNF